MIIVGVTGGIGSGKTTVCNSFNSLLNIPIYNTDVTAKKILNTNKNLQKELITLLGKETYKNNSYNTAYVAKKVFSSQILLNTLNNLVHPYVMEDFKKWVFMQKSPYVIKESALIFENNYQDNYDFIITVWAPLELRIERLKKNRLMTETQIKNRIKNQLSDKEKITLSDFNIKNITFNKSEKEVLKIHSKLINTINNKQD